MFIGVLSEGDVLVNLPTLSSLVEAVDLSPKISLDDSKVSHLDLYSN